MKNSRKKTFTWQTNNIGIYRQIFLSMLIISGLISTFQFAVSAQPNFIKGGRVDFTFNPVRQNTPIDIPTSTIVEQSDGKILAVGTFNTSPQALIRFLPNGTRDTTFNAFYPAGRTRPTHIAVQPDGKIIMGYEGQPNSNEVFLNFMVRLNPDGSLDNSFNFVYQNRPGTIQGIKILPDGKILMSGRFPDSASSQIYLPIIRLNQNGSLDTSFSSDIRASFGRNGILNVLPNGKIILSVSNGIGAIQNRFVIRLSENGIFEPAFNPILPSLPNPQIFQILIQNNEKILISGSDQPFSQPYFLRFDFAGNLDASFQPAFVSVGPFAVQDDNKILISPSGINRRLLPDGAIDNEFEIKVLVAFSSGIYPQSNGKIYYRGNFPNPNIATGIIRVHGNKTPPVNKSFDFDGDGKSDIGVFRPSNGTWHWLNSSTGLYSVLQFGLSGDKPVPSDYDGDGKTDIAVFRPSTGVWYGIRSSNGQVFVQQFGTGEDIPIPSDFDGDTKEDIAVFRPSNGTWYHLNSSTGSFSARQFGINGDIPVIGDLDGDFKSDLIVWRPSNGNLFSVRSSNNAASQSEFGFAGDRMIFYDYDIDGRTDTGIWRGVSGGWYLYQSLTTGSTYAQWGINGDIPVGADYDGDGKHDLAVFRPSTRTWWILRSSNSTYTSTFFGLNDDIPLQSVYSRQ